MAISEAQKVISLVEKALNARDLKKFRSLHAENVVLQAPDNPEPVRGVESVVKWYKGFFDAFPDMKATAGRSVNQGEWLAVEYTITGTHKGPLAGPGGASIPPTNKAVRVANLSLYRVKGGKVAEVHEYFDQLSFLTQLGLSNP
ncbi:MAG TPA: ester cyclase [Thermoplasmata archaeon]|nr:ester cyclase [Thermoplasmata archaeon]